MSLALKLIYEKKEYLRGLIIRRDMHLCKRWVWENDYSSLKRVERPINLYITLFDNHFPFQK